MSNPYKEWIEDRQEDAFEDIAKIAELWEELRNVQSIIDISTIMNKIDNILKEGKWI